MNQQKFRREKNKIMRSKIVSTILCDLVVIIILLLARSDAAFEDEGSLHQGGIMPIPDVIVAKDGSGKYQTITQALSDIPENSNRRFVIYVKEGTYDENIVFTSDGPTRTKIKGNKSKDMKMTETRDTATVVITVDFIFGNGKVVFQNCILLVRKPLPDQLCMVTAQGRTSAMDDTGFVLQNCKIAPAPDYPTKDKAYRTFIGRPWKPFARTVVLHTYLDAIVDPMGWSDWNQNTNYLQSCWFGEFGSYGPGGNMAQRIKSPGVMPISEILADKFTPSKFFGDDEWIVRSEIPYDP